ncbi:MAG: L,D-transpeptidase [Chitinophagales bacterium]
MRRELWFILLVLVGLYFNGCKAPANKSKDSGKKVSKEEAKKREADTLAIADVGYHLIVVNKKDKDSLEALMQSLAPEFPIVLALNRIDSVRVWRLDTLVVPDTLLDWNAYCPFPLELRAAKDIHKIIFYSYPVEAFAAYENGKLVRWGPVSLGKQETPTPTGLFHTNWRAKRTVSTVDDDWIMNWYFNLDNMEGVSMHEYEMPGYPASHACARLYRADAIFFYNWCQSWVLNKKQIAAYGTPVIIYGVYPWGERKPWRRLAEDKRAITITEMELGKQLQPYLPLILQRQQQRDSMEAVKAL